MSYQAIRFDVGIPGQSVKVYREWDTVGWLLYSVVSSKADWSLPYIYQDAKQNFKNPRWVAQEAPASSLMEDGLVFIRFAFDTDERADDG